MASPSFDPPLLLVRQQRAYARLVVPSLVLAVLALVAGAVEAFPPLLRGSLATGLFGSFVVAVTALRGRLRRDRRSLLAFALPAVAGALIGGAIHGAIFLRCPVAVTGGLGVGALCTVGAWTARARGAERKAMLAVLTPCALLPAFFVAGVGWTLRTAHFCPNVLDSFFYAMDTTLGFNAFDVGRIFAQAPWITPLAEAVYKYQWLALLLVYVRQIVDPRPRADALFTTIVATTCAIAVYYTFPVVGPAVAFENEFPWHPPEGAAMLLRPVVAFPDLRNCVPSMHNAWAILLVWQTKGYERWLRGVMWGILVVTVAGTLGFGFHYVFDIVVAVPFILAVHAATLPSASVSLRVRRSVVAAGAAMTAVCLVAVRFGTPLFLRARPLGPLLALGTVVTSVIVYRWLSRDSAPMSEEVVQVDRAPPARASRVALLLAGALGFVFVVYGLALPRFVELAFGGGGGAVATPLALVAFGVGLGAAFSGRVTKGMPPLRAVALFSVLGGLVAASTPWQLGPLGDMFGSLTSSSGGAKTLVLRALLQGIILLPLGVVTGAALPPLLTSAKPDEGGTSAAPALLSAGAVGAAVSAIVTGFWVLPGLGAHDALVFGTVGSLCVALVAHMSSRGAHDAGPAAAASSNGASAGPPVPSAISAIGGGLTLAVAVVYAHLMGTVIGDDVYSRSLALTSVLVGLALGARLPFTNASREGRVSVLGGALAASLLATALLWSRVPDYFASFAKYPYGQVFGERELVRLGACLVLSSPAAVSLGALLAATAMPATVARPTDADTGRAVQRGPARWLIAQASGGGLGVLLAGALLLPRLGSLRTLQTLALVATAVAIFATRRAPPARRRPAFAGLAVVAALLVAQPAAFDLDRLASGANVHFTRGAAVRVVAEAESLDDGLVTVARAKPGGPAVVSVDGTAEATEDEQGHDAVAMLFHARGRGRALLLGGGTGAGARILAAAGFEHLDIVEPSTARTSLAGASFGPLADAAVSTYTVGERVFLRRQREPYDAILVDAPSAPAAAVARFYSREFYALLHARLAAGGVVAERVPLERAEVADVFSIIVTMNDVFHATWLYAHDRDGVIIACDPACPARGEALAALVGRPELSSLLGDRIHAELAEPLLAPAGVAALVRHLEEVGHGKAWLIARDDDLGLAYSLARSSALAPAASHAALLEALRPYGADHLTL